MISAITVNHMKVIKEDNTDARWMVLSTFHDPSTQLINMESGEVCHIGDGGTMAKAFTETDEDLNDDERHKGFERMNSRRKGELHVDTGQIDVDEVSNCSSGSVNFDDKKCASVHKLHVVSNAGMLNSIKDVSNDPSREYLDMIAEELLTLTDHCVKGELRGIAISYVIMDDGEHVLSKHNFITDGRGIASLNAGIDLVKDYIVEAMRERFGVKKGE